jgi:8-oxo-dGTP diphosphatase
VTIRRPCAGGIVLDAAGRILLIRRGRPPSAGSWSVPGGRCEPGEAPADACVRELAEETGLVVAVERWAGQVERAAPDGAIYVIDDFVCRVLPGPLGAGLLRAGDDAVDARWFTRADLAGVDLAPGLYDALAGWGLLPT